MNKNFILEEAVLAWRCFFYVNLIERDIGWYDVRYNFKLKASELVFNGDFKRKFVGVLDICYLFTYLLICHLCWFFLCNRKRNVSVEM